MGFDVPFIRPVFPSAEVLSVDIAEIVGSNWFTNFGPKEEEFTRAIADYVGSGYSVVTFSNATVGLMAALTCLLGRGDGSQYVIAPSFTFAAGPEAIEWSGYKPLFVDIDASTVQPALADAIAAIDSPEFDIAAILLCNTFGIGNSQIAAWEQLARSAHIPLVIDSAAGFGSTYADGRRVGRAGDCEVFSFHATKPFAIGEGGAVVTRDPGLAIRLKEFTNFGFRDGKGAVALGLNGKLQEISAAIGLRQLAQFDRVLGARHDVLARYMKELALSGVVFPEQIENSSVCFASMLFPDGLARDNVRSNLLAKGVEARAYYSPPVHHQPHFESAARFGGLEVTEDVVSRILSVPVYQDMAEEHIVLILDAIKAGMN